MPLSAVSSAGFDAVVIAASLGGRAALEDVLAWLPADFRAPVILAHHLDARAPFYLPQLLARTTQLEVRRAVDREQLRAGILYVGPPGYHLLLTRAGCCYLSDGPRVNYSRPAADLLFTSAAEAFGPRTLGVVLSGRLYDGAAGAVVIRRAGGVVLVQDPETCRAPDMPRAAIRRGAVDFTLPPSALGAALVALVGVPGVPALVGLRQRSGAAA